MKNTNFYKTVRLFQHFLSFTNKNNLSSHLYYQRKSFTCGNNVLYAGEYEMQDPKSKDEIVNVVFIDKNSNKHNIQGKIGDNIMYLAHRHNIELEGACEASLACSTCHVYVDDKFLNKLSEATEKEEDLLDMAPGLKSNSRLGCQIILSKELEGIELKLPPITRNFYVDGHVPTPH